jgi:lipopolysaccharide export system protein LptA
MPASDADAPTRAARRSAPPARLRVAASLALLIPLAVAEPVRFAGGKLVLDQRSDTATLTGAARAISGSNTLTARRIVVYQRERYMVADGDVVMVNPAKKTRMTGDRIHFDNETEIATATGNPTLEKEDERISVTASVIRGYTKQDRAVALTNVFIHKRASSNEKNQMRAWSDTGEFFQNLNTLVLEKRCRIETENALAWCEKSRVVHGQETLTADSNVHILQWEGTNRHLTNNLWAQRVRYDYVNSNRQFLAWTNVVLLDAGDGSRMTGGFLRHRPAIIPTSRSVRPTARATATFGSPPISSNASNTAICSTPRAMSKSPAATRPRGPPWP